MNPIVAVLSVALTATLVHGGHVNFLSPSNGSSLMELPLNGIVLRAEVVKHGGSENVINVVKVEGAEVLRSEEGSISLQTQGIITPGILRIDIEGLDGRSGGKVYMETIFVMIANSQDHGLQNITCENFAIDHAVPPRATPGFGASKWKDMKRCLLGFLAVWPENDAANYHMARLMEAEGEFDLALVRYHMLLEHGFTQMQQRIRDVERLAAQEKARARCSWRSIGTCEEEEVETCPSRRSVEDVRISEVVNSSSLYLSVIMVTRHDNTQFCQVPEDACLDRFRASISVLASLLKETKLDEDAELILVEWNPCYVNSKKEEGACDEKEDRYLSVEEMVKDLVEAPQTKLSIRIMFVSEEVHDSLYNPFDFDLMEFIGKNVAARRAKGKFLLFANPDDVWSLPLVTQISRKKLREDVFYGTFRGFVLHHVPVNAGASAASMRRFVETNSESSEQHPLSVAHVAGRWRKAACLPGEVDEEPMRSERYGFFHDSAAGDFLLMPRKMVDKIRGYPEIPTNIMIDGTAIHAAAAHGFGQLLFSGPCVIFHQPHPRSYNTKGSMISLQAYEALAQQLLDAKEEANHRPDRVVLGERHQRVEEALEWHRYNDESWGLRDVGIPEVRLVSSCG